jgi:hypothetical protein
MKLLERAKGPKSVAEGNVVDEANENEEEIRRYLSLDEDHLYSIIGAYSADEGTMFHPHGQIESGKKYFESIRARLTDAICIKWSACEKIKDSRFDDTVQLVSAIGDVVSVIAVGVPPLTIASLVAKIGIKTLCDCRSEPK